MTLRWFHVPKAAEPDTLTALGIAMRNPFGKMVYYVDPESGRLLAEVGEITVYATGRIVVWPRANINQRHERTLLGCAELAFREPPSKKTGWWYRRRGPGKSYWASIVLVPVPEQHPIAMAVRAERTADTQFLPPEVVTAAGEQLEHAEVDR